ncbi:MAG: type II secretion system F family protein [Proteobacteria bacterium]|uniref:type II secretion system F family protein n=1 Tax=Aquabacterium sp. TaxID=1872578 RepID=UPI0035C78093|nr:type II secretion system F family protein [Pseudomonadota bacterium]
MSIWIALLLLFVAIVALVLWLFDAIFPDEARRRLADLAESSPSARKRIKRNHLVDVMARVTQPLSKLATPEGEEFSDIAIKLIHAGYRQRSAPTAYFGLKAALMLTLPALTFVMMGAMGIKMANGTQAVVAMIFPAIIGFYVPGLLLRTAVNRRQMALQRALPDAIDLMTVCVEAGQSMDMAMQRVGDELHDRNPLLSEELRIMSMEVRAGLSRELALRNLYARTGVDEIDSFSSMVIQADRFGTSLAQALRTHATTMRTRIRQRVEEDAAKMSTKLLFPMILCLFPGILFVLLGPAVLQLMVLAR